MGFVPTIGPANAARIKSIDGRYLFSSTVQRKCLNSYHDLITRHIYLKEMMAMLRACPNLEYFEIHVGDQRHRCNLRVLGHLVKIILQSHPTLTRAIEYLGTSQVSGMSPNDWCALVGKRDKLPNGRKLSHYVCLRLLLNIIPIKKLTMVMQRLLMDITTGYRVNIVGSNPWTDMVWTGEIPPRFESTQYPSRDYTIEDTVLAGTVLENTEDYNDDEFVVDGDDNLEERDMITIGEGGIYGVEVWREEEKIPLGHFTDANRVYMAPGFPVAVRISRDC